MGLGSAKWDVRSVDLQPFVRRPLLVRLACLVRVALKPLEAALSIQLSASN